jgi:hypothetical protein
MLYVSACLYILLHRLLNIPLHRFLISEMNFTKFIYNLYIYIYNVTWAYLNSILHKFFPQVKVKVTLRPTDSRPVRLGVWRPSGPVCLGVRLPSGTHDQFFPFSLWFFCLTVSGLLMWGALSDEKSGLYFSVFAGHCQRSLSEIWVPWDSWTQFIVSIIETPPTWRANFLYLFPPGTG